MKFKKLGKIAKVLGLSTATGYAASRTSSSSAEAPINAKKGAMVGFTAGALSLGAPRVFKSKIFRDTSKFVFRRIRGKIVPIRVKK